MSPPAAIKCHCNTCQRETNHDTLYEKRDAGDVDIGDGCAIDWGEHWRVVQCRGCESVSLRHDSWNSEVYDEKGRPELTTTYFPPRTFREPPRWMSADVFDQICPAEINRLMKELYVCLQNDCCASSAMLTRAILERTMIHNVGDQGSFEKNLTAFEQAGFIGKKQKAVVESMLEAGHASMHRAFIPKRADIVTLVDLLEGLLEVVYFQRQQADDLKRRVPRRK
jgi:Domain of unknown function (DUF4145)